MNFLKKLVCFLCLFSVATSSFCQTKGDEKRLKEIIKTEVKKQEKKLNVKELDKLLLKYPSIKNFPEVYSYFLSKRLDLNLYSIEHKLQKLSPQEKAKDASIDTFLQLYMETNLIISNCVTDPLYLKYLVYDDLNMLSEFDNSDLQSLKSNGFKEPKSGAGLGVNYLYSGGKSYIGAEYSIYNDYDPSFKFLDESLAFSSRYTTNISLLSVAYNHSLSDKKQNITINILQALSPIYFRPTQIGWHWQPSQKGVFFYRPELGLGYKNLYAGVGYNVVSKKSRERLPDKFIFNVGCMFTVGKNK